MDRCKLEYMIKRFDFNEKKKIIREMDPYGDYMFKKDMSKFLLNPETKDPEILMNVGPYCLLYICACNNSEDFDTVSEYEQLMKKELEEIKEQYIAQYQLINDLCKKNNAYPFFSDVTNIAECEKTRLDIVKIIPEQYINDFFEVECIRDYEPPIYNESE